MMDITAILHMHAELSLTAVFILMFLLDLFLPAPQRHWLRPMACILLTIQLLANLWPEEVTLFGGMYHSTPMASVLKSILTIGTILVFLQADTWLKREDTRHKQGEFYRTRYLRLSVTVYLHSPTCFSLHSTHRTCTPARTPCRSVQKSAMTS